MFHSGMMGCYICMYVCVYIYIYISYCITLAGIGQAKTIFAVNTFSILKREAACSFPKCWYLLIKLRDVTFHKTVILFTTPMNYPCIIPRKHSTIISACPAPTLRNTVSPTSMHFLSPVPVLWLRLLNLHASTSIIIPSSTKFTLDAQRCIK
jgi:hypothetical protein